ncbi:3TM-type holin [Sphingobium sp.]|uniref:3TM-type holin n=1 Tax=Sphingobium sp. TaxID=1912891 RepID=UPI0025803513|nr:3TM-type holin [Sphingobium sp.]
MRFAPSYGANVARSCLFQSGYEAMVSESIDPDPWATRARPTFLYVMYALLLWSLPMGVIAGWRPAMAAAITAGMRDYLNALPEPLYALFGTGYLGYTAARAWGKAKGAER